MIYSKDNAKGYELMAGATRYWAPTILVVVMVYFASWAGHHFWGIGNDATDPPHGVSGVQLVTDYGTGCQYLAFPNGGITPRMDATGKQICKRAR